MTEGPAGPEPDNERLLRQQATALSAGQVTHPSLDRQAEGPLGEAMQTWAGQISEASETRDGLETRLEYESTHDGLTGLLNRSAAAVTLQQGLARIRRSGGGLGVIQIDIDRLGVINDTAGQAAGDEVLRRTGQTVAGSARSEDVVARLGSGEFVVITETPSIDVLMDLATRVVEALREVRTVTVPPFRAVPLADGISVSVGIAVTFDGRPEAADLLRDAATAVRKAKSHGGGRIEILDDGLREELDARARITDALAAALEAGELRLEYQPITDIAGRTVGVEALCRWTHPVLGSIPPQVFVEAAEASDLVLELDRWVLHEAVGQIRQWDAEGTMSDAYLSVNISGRHLRGYTLVRDVRAALEGSGVPPSRLLIEITETVLLSDLEAAASQLNELRELGVRVAVDDFGTGYTSVAHLQRLPVDVLKIDRSFVVAMNESKGESLVRLMVDMASVLGLGVVAEGVETAEELERLRAMGVPLVQGFLMGRPARPETLPAVESRIDDPVMDGETHLPE